ncbi:pseudaminic acid cytidylyltransferase [Algoriphagus yeomjeoni]|uniref:N-acylneuraminate cytidylyltransferase n=1 Tax=Algoriphagus yeomjeoni TaxID=291403 RepID=A0A327PPS3_9BACT|nr:pseudaminic acid cytidylyltransferase [Algoriphagus yeomjeoni]RAI91666.1 N-acylneuraminate cytidylyltransferase [Algoriphagus yeomjeoni]
MGNLCIIPARGGSKRIPRKNIKDFLGKPIIAYSIEAALNSGIFDEVMVSTDDEEIAQVAKKYGANVPFLRSKENADDFATTSQVLLEVIGQYEIIGKIYQYACCIYPTAPLIKKAKLIEGFKKLKDHHLSTVFPVVAFSYPIWRGLKKSSSQGFAMLWPENLNKRSQDLEEVYHDAGQWYWIDVEKFLTNHKLFDDNSSCIVLEATEVQDIDNMTDWKLAELKYELL